MGILLIAATAFEIAPFIANKPTNTEVLITGVGVPNTLYYLQQHLYNYDYQLIIQAGIAGSFNEDEKLSTVVAIEKDIFADIGFNEKGNFTPLHQSALVNNNVSQLNSGWLVNTDFINTINLPKVTGVTVNTVTDNLKHIEELKRNFAPSIETMEGAALHFVCLQKQLPFIQIRSISNYVGERDKSKWKITSAVEALNKTLFTLF
jgi:futalosine hydrolase